MIRYLVPILMLLAVATSARAEYIGGLNTWIVKDAGNPAMLSYDPTTSDRYGWTANGRVYDCNRTGRDEANFRVSLYCPAISIAIMLSRDTMDVANAAGTNTYHGEWDDRRAFMYNAPDFRGMFQLHDNFRWSEDQYRGAAGVGHYDFVETSRGAAWIYLHDDARNFNIALGADSVYMQAADGPWTRIYAGKW